MLGYAEHSADELAEMKATIRYDRGPEGVIYTIVSPEGDVLCQKRMPLPITDERSMGSLPKMCQWRPCYFNNRIAAIAPGLIERGN